MTQLTLFGEPATGAGPRPAAPVLDPAQISELLGLPPPTVQQAAIIAAPLAPVLVIAGAGSGKTETMAARVIYLVANRLVRPEQVLGLTFTRKASGELAHRVRQRLTQLARTREFAPARGELLAGEPTIATYHSYAGRIVGEYGLRAGFEPTARLLTEAACWQVADAVVRGYDGDMRHVAVAVSTVTDAVLALAADLAEHLRGPDELEECTRKLVREIESRPGPVSRDVAELLRRQTARMQLLPLVEAYRARKRAAEAIDFADQIARAAVVAREDEQVGRGERDRFRVVLLDEYQDTSHAQVVLLQALFGGAHPVTAVGDPCQSIYGWRGASAGTLERFPTDFPRSGGVPAGALELTVSWRNAQPILTVANALSDPLRAYGHAVPLLECPSLGGREAPDQPGVRCALLDTAQDEASWIAAAIAQRWRAGPGPARPTTAVLVRARKQIPVLERALRDAGLPVEVVGLGGLLDTPEVREILATLQVLADPAAGAALQRLVTGPRWRIGPRDLVALHRRARVLARERRERAGDAAVPDNLDLDVLAEGLTDLGPADGYSAEGYLRLCALRGELDALRGRLDQSLPDLVADVERTLTLDVEADLVGRAHLDAFADVAAHFAAEAEAPTLSAFLAYLSAAEEEERGLEPGQVELVEDAVQILTVHAAKGLEWDVVAVAGMATGIFPAREQHPDHWLSKLGALPFPLRGDRSGLPVFDVSACADQQDVKRAREDFLAAWAAHREREERRLAYVAVTRPRHWLLCSGYWWDGDAKGRRGPSAFLDEIRGRCLSGAGAVDRWAPPPADDAVNPVLAEPLRTTWPFDPLGDRRARVAAGAELVRSFLAGSGPRDGPAGDEVAETRRWADEADLLLAERARARPDVVEVVLPAHLSVSQLVSLRQDPVHLARRIRRPLPDRPDPSARRGTAFHRWLEQRYGGDRLLDLDELPGAADADAAPDELLSRLQERFLASEWADRRPAEVEVPFATVVAGVVLRGRIDAVFADADNGFDVIDWKTGRVPAGRDLTAAAVQLAAYRLAWAQLAGVAVSSVRAGFHYVQEGATLRPADLLDAEGLAALISGVPRSSSTPAGTVGEETGGQPLGGDGEAD